MRLLRWRWSCILIDLRRFCRRPRGIRGHNAFSVLRFCRHARRKHRGARKQYQFHHPEHFGFQPNRDSLRRCLLRLQSDGERLDLLPRERWTVQ